MRVPSIPAYGSLLPKGDQLNNYEMLDPTLPLIAPSDMPAPSMRAEQPDLRSFLTAAARSFQGNSYFVNLLAQSTLQAVSDGTGDGSAERADHAQHGTALPPDAAARGADASCCWQTSAQYWRLLWRLFILPYSATHRLMLESPVVTNGV